MTRRPTAPALEVRRARYWAAFALAALVVLSGVVVYEVAVLPLAPRVYSSVNVTVQIGPNASGTVPPDFLGVNVRSDGPLGSPQAAGINQTAARLVRWPGGALADRFDALGANDGGLIYNDNGTATLADTSLAGFAAWCRDVGCRAIVTVPVEIANASYAGALARYSVTTLGFSPAYWELGNEPARWNHFGVPWSLWIGVQNITPTPAQYTSAAAGYISAIRAVEPGAKFLAPGGVGFGGATETTWVNAVVVQLGRNLSGVSMHVYPAGNGNYFGASSTFFESLEGPGGIPARVAAVTAAAHGACGSCRLSVFLDEFAAQTGNPPGGFVVDFPLVPYVAAELVQALQSGVSATAFWVFQSGYPAAWFAPDGTPRPTFELYSSVVAALPAPLRPTTLVGAVSGLFAQAFGANGTPAVTLLLVNANATTGMYVNLSAFLPASGEITREFWDGSTSAPVRAPFGGTGGARDLLPPLSLARYDGLQVPAALPRALAHSENSGIAPGSIVPYDSTVKYCFSAPVTGQIPIHGIVRALPIRIR